MKAVIRPAMGGIKARIKTGLAGALLALGAWCLSAFMVDAAQAQIKVGITFSVTGPAASLGIPARNTISLFPDKIGGLDAQYIVLDDASDPTQAVRNIRKLTAEENVDVVIGSNISPPSIAMIPVAAESRTPMISIGGSARIVEPMDAQRAWVFKIPQNDALLSHAIVQNLRQQGKKTLALMAFSDAYGDGWVSETRKQAQRLGVEVVQVERFMRTATSTIGQVLKLMAARPDAVLIIGAGTPCVLPQKELRAKGYQGLIYQTQGVANNEFLRVGGKDVEGTLMSVGPVLVADQLPASPIRDAAMDYMTRFEAAHGAGTTTVFGAHAWDILLMLQKTVPLALQQGRPQRGLGSDEGCQIAHRLCAYALADLFARQPYLCMVKVHVQRLRLSRYLRFIVRRNARVQTGQRRQPVQGPAIEHLPAQRCAHAPCNRPLSRSGRAVYGDHRNGRSRAAHGCTSPSNTTK